jgi:hypothetical protein
MREPAHRPNNGALLQVRSWHRRVGLAVALFAVLLASTGIYLNHTDFFRFDPLPPDSGRLLTTTTAADAAPVPFDRALTLARSEWGDVSVQFSQLREEGVRLVYKVRRRGHSDELTVDARTGYLLANRGAVRETRFADDGAAGETRVSWTRLLFDLHTGRIAGLSGKLVTDSAAVGLAVLVASGLYLFAVPRLRKRRSARQQAAQAPGGPTPGHPPQAGHRV